MGIYAPDGVSGGTSGGGGITAPVAWSDMTALTASRAAVTDASGFVTVATTTAAELGHVAGVTSAIQTQLNTNATNVSTVASAVTTIVTWQGSVTQTELGYVGGVTSSIQTQINGKAATVHTHAAADVVSGVFNIARLATGTPDGTKFVRDDGTLAVPTSSGGITIGTTTITGGATTQILYNNTGVVQSHANFVTNGTVVGIGGAVNTSYHLTITGGSTSGMLVTATAQTGIAITQSSGAFSGLTITHSGDGSSCGAITASAADNGTYVLQATQSGAVTNYAIGCVQAVMTSTSNTGSAIYASNLGNGDGGQCIYCYRQTNGTTTAGDVIHISSTSSGTPAAGFGGQINWQLKSSTTADENAMLFKVVWAVATHASRTSNAQIWLVDNAGAIANAFTFTPHYLNIVSTTGSLVINGQQMVAYTARQTYGVPTGTLSRATFVTDSETLPNVAARLGQLIIDLQAHGLLA